MKHRTLLKSNYMFVAFLSCENQASLKKSTHHRVSKNSRVLSFMMMHFQSHLRGFLNSLFSLRTIFFDPQMNTWSFSLLETFGSKHLEICGFTRLEKGGGELSDKCSGGKNRVFASDMQGSRSTKLHVIKILQSSVITVNFLLKGST